MDENSLILPQILDGEDKSSPFKNRIRKNYRHLRRWAKRSLTDSFRIYDRDIKEYPLAIDFFAGRFSVQYFSYDNDLLSFELKKEVEEVLLSIFSTSQDKIFWRTRIRRKKTEQYEKLDEKECFFITYEYGVKFRVNLQDYLDTGLFLDHRETRKMVASLSKGKRILNLFAYTCSFSVHAALAGALYTKSVDLSNTYTDWGKENFKLNSLDLKKNEIIRADCLVFLEEAIKLKNSFDLIIIDPPTISRSKKMDQFFDIQQDHLLLISKALKLLDQNGLIIFSTNSRKFKLDSSLSNICQITEITDKTIPLDFHHKNIHRCWKFYRS
jgi:23S rRNA (cytosine1962-C5)-methyltransferase